MMPLDLFQSRTFAAANLYTLFLYAALGGSLYFLPYLLVNVQHYSPTAAGASMLPFVLTMFFASRWSGGLTARIGARIPLVIGALIAGLGFAAFALRGLGGSYWTTYFPAALLLGIGGALFVAPLTTAVFDAAPAEKSGVASGVNNAVARTAGLIAVAALGIVLAGVFNAGFDRRIARHHLSAQTAQHRPRRPGAAVCRHRPARRAGERSARDRGRGARGLSGGIPRRDGRLGRGLRAGGADRAGGDSGSVAARTLRRS